MKSSVQLGSGEQIWPTKTACFSLLFLLKLLDLLIPADAKGVKYLYYTGDHRKANWTDAQAKCKASSGVLAGDIDIDDWELLYGKSEVFLDDSYFWIGLRRNVTDMMWYWSDGSSLDTTLTAAYPLQPEFQENITWNCVQWNVKEPFYVPQHCDYPSPFICKVTDFSCNFKYQGTMKVNESSVTEYSDGTQIATVPAYLVSSVSNDNCKKKCLDYTTDGYECWMYEYHKTLDVCKLIISSGKPVLINTQTEVNVDLYSKYCVEVEKFTTCTDGEECICGNVTSNPTPKQLELIIEETKEKLTVPTKNLSATIRKKTSAPDDRPSSQTMGFFGISMITITLGGLVLLDCTSMLRDLKIMVHNLKCVTGNARELPPPTLLQVNLPKPPKSTFA